ALGARTAEDLGPVSAGPLPREIRPMGAALDGLFARVAAAREREKSFTAFAAHELKTPLVGIKTQAQIAAMAPDEATRQKALARIESGVARTDRMVRQLLELAAVDGAPVEEGGITDMTRLVTDVAQEVGRLAAEREVRIRVEMAPGLLCRISDPVLPAVALRNIVENAVLASPPGERGRDRGNGAGPTDRRVGSRSRPGDSGGGPAPRDRAVLSRGERFGGGERAGPVDRAGGAPAVWRAARIRGACGWRRGCAGCVALRWSLGERAADAGR
ncbi:hypothetical protein NHG85_03740, partial [Limimaricola sp. ASW11-118]